MTKKVADSGFLRWIVVVACLLIIGFTFIYINDLEATSLLILALTIVSCLLGIFRQYWWLLGTGAILLICSIYISAGIMDQYGHPFLHGEFIAIPAFVLLLIPFIDLSIRQK